MRRLALAVLTPTLALAAVPGDAIAARPLQDQMISAHYICERDTRLDAVFLNTAGGNSFAVIALEGRLVPMTVAISASGARYLSAPDTAGMQYQFWTKGNEATLSTLLGQADTPLLSACVSAGPIAE